MGRKILFDGDAWDEFIDWQYEDKKTQRRILELIKEIRRTPFEGKGKPEALKYDMAGLWSRRIDDINRLVYKVTEDTVIIFSCKYHYNKNN